MTYHIQRANKPVETSSGWNQSPWSDVQSLEVKHYMGEKPSHFPRTEAKLLYDDENLYVFFQVEDNYVRSVSEKLQDMVCRDSCVEFFFTPSQDISDGYFNMEVNCGGIFLLYHQIARGQNPQPVDVKDCGKIKVAASMPKITDPEIQKPTVWTVQYALPIKMLEKYAPVVQPAPGVQWKANFYKCADETSHPHWLTWSVVDKPQPDFHQPKFFGTLIFE